MIRRARHFQLDPLTLALIVITLIGFWLRASVNSQPMEFDEAYTFLEYGAINPLRAIARYNLPNNHVFHTVLMQIVYRAFGTHEWILRLPVFICGVLAIPMTYRVGARVYNRAAGVIAAGIVAAHVWTINYSTDARGYAIHVLLFLLQLDSALSLLRRPTRGRWIALAVFSALGMWTIPSYAYPLGVVYLWLLASIVMDKRGHEQRVMLRDFMVYAVIGGAVLTLILYAPIWTRPDGFQALFANPFVASSASDPQIANEMSNATVNVSSLITVIDYTMTGFSSTAAFILSGWIVISVFYHKRFSKISVPILIIALVWIMALMLIQGRTPPDRTWTFLIPLLAIYLSIIMVMPWVDRSPSSVRGRERLWESKSVCALWSIALTLALSFSLITGNTLNRYRLGVSADAREIAAALRPIMTPDDIALLPLPHSAPVRFYLFPSALTDAEFHTQYSALPADYLQTTGVRRVFAFICTDSCAVNSIDELTAAYGFDIASGALIFTPIHVFDTGTLGELRLN